MKLLPIIERCLNHSFFPEVFMFTFMADKSGQRETMQDVKSEQSD